MTVKKSTETRRYVNKSLRKALSVLDVFDNNRQEATLTEVANSLHTRASSIYPIVSTLESAGYLERNPDTKRYRLGLKLLSKVNQILAGLDLRDQAKPVMRQLTRELSSNSYLGVLYDNKVLYIDREEATPGTSAFAKPILGFCDHVHATALGKVLLAHNPVQAKEVLQSHPLPRITIQTITDPITLERELDLVAKQGYALDREESQIGDICVGAPIWNYHGKAIAALSVTLSRIRYEHNSIENIAETVIKAANKISRLLGYSGEEKRQDTLKGSVER